MVFFFHQLIKKEIENKINMYIMAMKKMIIMIGHGDIPIQLYAGQPFVLIISMTTIMISNNNNLPTITAIATTVGKCYAYYPTQPRY